MWTRQHKRRKIGRLVVPVLAAGFISYFGYHAFQGEYGLKNKQMLEVQVAELEDRLGKVTRLRAKLEARNLLLHDGTLERDMLDERTRATLGSVHPDEIVILLAPKN